MGNDQGGQASQSGQVLFGRPWASHVNAITASIEQTMRVMKSGGLSQPGIAEHLQSSRTSASMSEK